MAKPKKDVVYLVYKGKKPYSNEKITAALYGGKPPPYDRELLFDYIKKVFDNKGEHDPVTIAATKALRDALLGVDLMKQVGIKWKKIPDDPEYIAPETIHHPAFSIVMAALNNEFPDDGMTQRQHAEAEIAELFCFGLRSAQEYYDKVKDNAATTLKAFKKMFSDGGFEFKAMEFEKKSIDLQIRDIAASSMPYNEKMKAVQALTGKPRREVQQLYNATIRQ